MDFIAKSFMVKDHSKLSSGLRKDALVLSAPILKLHINANTKDHQISKANMHLSAQEKINLG